MAWVASQHQTHVTPTNLDLDIHKDRSNNIVFSGNQRDNTSGMKIELNRYSIVILGSRR